MNLNPIVVVVTARPSWARVQTVCEALREAQLPVQIVVAASALLHRFGAVVEDIIVAGFSVIRVPAVIEGDTLETGVLTTATLTAALGRLFATLEPRLVITVADRRETLATAIAARYQEIPLLHLLAGERSGSVDDAVRAAVSALATYRLSPAQFGCPSVDLATRAIRWPPLAQIERGTGSPLDLRLPFLMLLQHPTTDRVADAAEEMSTTVEALRAIRLPVLACWPGEEAGTEAAAKVLRQMRETSSSHAWQFVTHVPALEFYQLLNQTACLIGNSSVGLRECAFLGTPVVNLGTRQRGRRRGQNAIDVMLETSHPEETGFVIRRAVAEQLAHGRYPSSALYGTGQAGQEIASWIQRELAALSQRAPAVSVSPAKISVP